MDFNTEEERLFMDKYPIDLRNLKPQFVDTTEVLFSRKEVIVTSAKGLELLRLDRTKVGPSKIRKLIYNVIWKQYEI